MANSIVVSTFDLKQKVSPGSTYTVNGNISSIYGNLVLISSFAYMGDSHASLDGQATGRAGARFTANTTANYKIDDRAAISVNLSWNFAEKNFIPNNTFNGLIVEPKNSNSHVVIGSIEPSYLITDPLRVAANYSFLYRDHNFYDQLQDQFIAAKQKQSVGGSATYAFSPAASVTLRGSHAWIRQYDGALLVTDFGPPPLLVLQPPGIKYEVWAGSIAATMRF